jgi:hypothetical protein
VSHRYWYRLCPVCEQGRLFIYRDKTHDSLFLMCEECNRMWRDPVQVGEAGTGYHPEKGDFVAELPSKAQITAAGWDQYCVHAEP